MVKRIVDFSIKNKLAIVLMTIIITLGGVYSASKMKMEMLPDIDSPVLTITTPYPGATPETVLNDVTEKIESRVKSMEGVEDIQSQSLQNASAITVIYDYGTDMDKATDEVETIIDELDLPDGVESSSIDTISMYTFPIISYSFTEKDNDLKDLTQRLEEDLIPEIEGVEGVSSASFSGQQIERVELSFDEAALKKHDLKEDDVLQFISGTSNDFPLGLYTFDDELRSILIDGRFNTVEELKELNIPAGEPEAPEIDDETKMKLAAMSDAEREEFQKEMEQKALDAGLKTVKLKDVAEINTVSERESISKTNGKDSLAIQVVKSNDANTVAVANEIKETVDTFLKDNKDIDAVLMMDQAKPIEDSIKTMFEKALLGAAFAVIVILLFLRDFKSTLISVVSIPMSILMAFVILKQLDVSINIMTLGAMTVAIGRVIDDSIVVIENIYRRLTKEDETLQGRELITAATKQMFIPIMSSTIVTIVVFVPLAFITGEVGQIFKPFALTVVFALLASLLIAITIVPMLAHFFFRKGVKVKPHHKKNRIADSYRKILEWTLSHKVISSIVLVVIFVGSLALTPFVGTSFISTGEDKFLALTYKPSPGETIEEVVKHGEEAEQELKKNSDVTNIQYSAGGDNPFNPVASNDMAMMVEYKSDTENFEEESAKVLEKLEQFDHKGTWSSIDVATGGASNEVKVTIKGTDFDKIKAASEEVEAVLSEHKELSNVKSDVSDSYTEYRIVVDQEKAAKLGLTAGQIAMELNQYEPKQVVTEVGEVGKTQEVILKHDKKENWTEDDLKNNTIKSPLGKDVKYSEFTTIETGDTQDTIKRLNGDMYATVSGKILSNDVGTVTSEVIQEVNKLEVEDGVTVEVGGTNDDIEESFQQLGLAMLAAILIVYVVLVLTFHGGIAPFSILFSLPFTITGVIIALLISGETLSVPALIGLLMLIGIVVTNAIVLIDRVIHMEERGLSTRDALLEAASTRVRPILMTALATIGALIPLIFGGDSSILISRALGITVIGGLVSSTLLTLIVVPIVYEVLMNIKHKFVKN
ncbi:multidrug transporter [Nosocomiicoccus sp. HMSC067E10]|uniref:efflux RND transporter permease subunit n=1 Tax=Nosocomiicoccus sp. HMSC067E10 TaxID=1739271 RepID=UPI0008A2942F|nr:efflux RND transporter permease subunit [Nosocomiicoccus sp. HMSC067E10]OFL46924.1 multidrug transporter [Nosocomiicoccus sp. HMSC067E10]